MKSTLGKVILARLRALEKTQSWLAEQSHVSINAASKWIRTGKISRENLVVVAGVLDISTDELVGLDDLPGEAPDVPALDLVYLDDDEIRLITLYRQATQDGRKMIEISARNAPKDLIQQSTAIVQYGLPVQRN